MKYFSDVITFPLNKKELQNFLHEVYLGPSFIHSWFIEPYFKTKKWHLSNSQLLSLDATKYRNDNFSGHEKMKINPQY